METKIKTKLKMEKIIALTLREKMENVLRSAAEALMAGVNMKTVVKQLDENNLRIYEDDSYKPYRAINWRIVTSNEYQNENETEIWFHTSMDKRFLVYILSFGYNNQFEITPD